MLGPAALVGRSMPKDFGSNNEILTKIAAVVTVKLHKTEYSAIGSVYISKCQEQLNGGGGIDFL